MTHNKSNIKIICTVINLNDLAIIFPIFNIIISNNHVNTICWIINDQCITIVIKLSIRAFSNRPAESYYIMHEAPHISIYSKSPSLWSFNFAIFLFSAKFLAQNAKTIKFSLCLETALLIFFQLYSIISKYL